MEELSLQRELSGHMIYLVSCALHDTVPEKKLVEKIDLDALYRLAASHSLAALVCMALDAAGIFGSADPVLVKKWTDTKYKAVRKNLLLDTEREEIFRQMDAEGIWYLPLKGVVLKELYPEYGARQMADNDILFDASRREDMKKLMAERGYEITRYGKGNHDIYEKPPVYCYEMHVSLFGKGHREKWQDYYKNVKERLIPDGAGSYGYHFGDEDFYIYLVTHAYKHFDDGGTGLRSLADMYLYIWKKGRSLDWDYIKTELRKLEAAGFEEKSRVLAVKLFSDPVPFEKIKMTEEEQGLLDVFVGSGTYGTMRKHVESSLKKMGRDGGKIDGRVKIKYCLGRLFPGMEWYESNAPFCYKHKWTIPFYDVFRIIRGILGKTGKIREELRAVREIEGEKGS